ncbi:DUF4326 domain-containing protein [Vibrio cyclitrophicus]
MCTISKIKHTYIAGVTVSRLDKRLECFCKPEACHGDVLADYLNSWDDGK